MLNYITLRKHSQRTHSFKCLPTFERYNFILFIASLNDKSRISTQFICWPSRATRTSSVEPQRALCAQLFPAVCCRCLSTSYLVGRGLNCCWWFCTFSKYYWIRLTRRRWNEYVQQQVLEDEDTQENDDNQHDEVTAKLKNVNALKRPQHFYAAYQYSISFHLQQVTLSYTLQADRQTDFFLWSQLDSSCVNLSLLNQVNYFFIIMDMDHGMDHDMDHGSGGDAAKVSCPMIMTVSSQWGYTPLNPLPLQSI